MIKIYLVLLKNYENYVKSLFKVVNFDDVSGGNQPGVSASREANTLLNLIKHQLNIFFLKINIKQKVVVNQEAGKCSFKAM